MPLPRLTIVVTFCLFAHFVQAAGIQLIEVPAGNENRPLIGAAWYPCVEPDQRVKLHGLSVPGVQDCPIAGDKLPLIVISHGRSGWFGGHHDTAAALANAGFVVVAINHPGDNAFDMSRVDDLSLLIDRPTDVRRLIDFMTGDWAGASKIDKEHVGFFGFSKGAYTGLAVVGGRPNFRRALELCSVGEINGPCESLARFEISPVIQTRDIRVKAAVLADPANTFLFGPDDLKDVDVPLEVWSSELGGAGVTRESVAAISRKLPSKPTPQVVPKAGHWAFLAPCSTGQASSNPKICADGPEFDRAAFHQIFNASLVAFFREQLGK
jgi:predicted dienelactone hydrolase